MNYSILKRAEKFLVRSFQLQLYLTLISGPILVYWGLPISLASPIGNIVFHPLLTLFLFLSSLIFFCQILHIPHGICIYGLQKTSHLFHYLLGFGSQQWLMGFAKPPLWILFVGPLATACIFCCKKTRTPYRSIGCLLLLSILLGSYLKYTCKPLHITDIACNNGNVKLIYADNQIVLIDPGVIGARLSSNSWVEFTLVPNITQMTGRTSINHLIILQPSQLTFDAICTLAHSCQVKKIYMPLWQGDMTRNQKRSYARFMQTVRENSIEIIRIKSETTISLDQDTLTLTPQIQKIKSKMMEYRVWHVTGSVKSIALDCRSYKANNKKISVAA
jgi:hypothetical protein